MSTKQKTKKTKAVVKNTPTKTVEKVVAPFQTLRSVETSSIKVTKLNPRKNLGDVTELTTNIKQHGLLQPLVCRESKNGKKIELLCGHRRLSVLEDLEIAVVEVRVLPYMDDVTAITIMVSENSGDVRSALSPMDEARAFDSLLQSGIKNKKIAKLCGCSEQKVRRALKLVDAPKEVKKRLEEGTLTKMNAIQLADMAKDDTKKYKAVIEQVEETTTEQDLQTFASEYVKENAAKTGTKVTQATSGVKASSTTVAVLWRTKNNINDQIEEQYKITLNAQSVMDKESDADSDNYIAAENEHVMASVVLATLAWVRGVIETPDYESEEFTAYYASLGTSAVDEVPVPTPNKKKSKKPRIKDTSTIEKGTTYNDDIVAGV